MRVLMVAHAMPGDASVAAARVEWLVNDLAPFGVDSFLLALRPQRVKRRDDGSVAPIGCIESVTVAGNPHVGWRDALSAPDGGLTQSVIGDSAVADPVARGLRIVETFRPDVVLSTVPHLVCNEVAYRISSQSGLPWIIDWRDPLSLRPLRMWPSRRYYKALAERESEWVRAAALHVATAPSWAAILKDRYPGVNVRVVTNGWRCSNGPRDITAVPGSLAYTGSLAPVPYGFAANMYRKKLRHVLSRVTSGLRYYMPFATAVEYEPLGLTALRAIERNRDKVSTAVFRGEGVNSVVQRELARFGLGELALSLPWSSREEASKTMASAHVLWICLAGLGKDRGEPVISTKVFDYLASGRPIFAVLPPRSDTAALLRGQPGVFMPDPADEKALADGLAEALSLPPGERFERDIEDYRRDQLAKRMASVLERVCCGLHGEDA